MQFYNTMGSIRLDEALDFAIKGAGSLQAHPFPRKTVARMKGFYPFRRQLAKRHCGRFLYTMLLEEAALF
jgi:hypothetical protein